MNLIAFWYEMIPEKHFWFYGDGAFHCMETLKKLSNTRVQSDFANVNFSRDIWDLKKNCWWLLHLVSNFFFFNLENMYSFFSKRNVWSLWFMLYSCHGKKRDPVYCERRHLSKIKGRKYHLIDKQSCPAWHFPNPSKDTQSWSSVT